MRNREIFARYTEHWGTLWARDKLANGISEIVCIALRRSLACYLYKGAVGVSSTKIRIIEIEEFVLCALSRIRSGVHLTFNRRCFERHVALILFKKASV